ncbi:MAG: GNAT family N-acetyltransferase [Gemmatimonadales bacterium]
MTIPESFQSARLRAERLTPEHLPEIIRMHQNPEVMAYLGGLRDDGRSKEYLEKNLLHWAAFGFGLWIVYEAKGTRPVGRGLLRHLTVDGVDEIETGYAFYPEVWGRGYATEIATACIDLARRHLTVSSIVALTRPDNHGSQRVLQKSGMTLDREILHEGTAHLLFRTGVFAPP